MPDLGLQQAEEPACSLQTFSAVVDFFYAVPANFLATTATLPAITCLVSTAVSFAALTNEGTVLSWGSALHPHLLARRPTKDAPEEVPCPIPFLEGLQIRKIAAGGWISIAISQFDDLYIWGGQPGVDTSRHISCLPDWRGGEDVKLVDIDDQADILDAAVGDGHAIALTKKGEVWVTGEGYEGQLGLGTDYQGFEQGWTRAHGWGDKTVLAVEAGGFNSFVRVARPR